jgi:hypothetical protein
MHSYLLFFVLNISAPLIRLLSVVRAALDVSCAASARTLLIFVQVENVFEPSDDLPPQKVRENRHGHGVEERHLQNVIGDVPRRDLVGHDHGLLAGGRCLMDDN